MGDLEKHEGFLFFLFCIFSLFFGLFFVTYEKYLGNFKFFYTMRVYNIEGTEEIKILIKILLLKIIENYFKLF